MSVSESQPRITYGLMETDRDATPVGRVVEPVGRPSFVHWELPIRRKRFETWRDESGELWGRWEWEYV